ncbi:MAG: hypothetical protein QXL94_06670 [Candidatus Parvarchaeum sp.]
MPSSDWIHISIVVRSDTARAIDRFKGSKTWNDFITILLENAKTREELYKKDAQKYARLHDREGVGVIIPRSRNKR